MRPVHQASASQGALPIGVPSSMPRIVSMTGVHGWLRANPCIHPGIVGDSPFCEGKNLDQVIARTPLRRLATMADVADAVEFLLRNRAVNGENLTVNGGRYLT